MKKKELKSAVKELLHQVSELNVRVTQLEYPPKEEIDLLDSHKEKKELEVGKWYKCDDWLLMYDKDLDNCSGWYKNRYEYKYWSFDKKESAVTEATPQEVESALIAEAKRRYKIGDLIKCFDNIESEVKGFDFIFNNNNLFLDGERFDGSDWLNTSSKVFNNGKWATIIEQDEFSELKEAHKNGAIIECLQNYGEWFEIENPQWDEYSEYRIKPELKPKVGDVVKAWNDNPYTAYVIGRLSTISNEGFLIGNEVWFQNSTPLTQQEAIDLLFKK